MTSTAWPNDVDTPNGVIYGYRKSMAIPGGALQIKTFHLVFFQDYEDMHDFETSRARAGGA